jgi:hypothetical protein
MELLVLLGLIASTLFLTAYHFGYKDRIDVELKNKVEVVFWTLTVVYWIPLILGYLSKLF